MKAKLLLILVCLGLFSSCTYMPSDTESLLQAPRLNTRQQQVYEALEATMNLSTVVYQYPQGGAYRSPFLFYDLDGDGLEEAMVLYSFQSDTATVRVKILQQDEGGRWSALHDFSINCDSVEFVQFSHLLDEEAACLIIGWQSGRTQGTRTAETTLDIYSLQNGEFIPVLSLPYLHCIIQDFDGDGLEEIVAVERSSSQLFRVSLVQAEGRHLVTGATHTLTRDCDVVLQMTAGTLWDGTPGLFFDEVLANTAVVTEVLGVGGSGFNLLVGGDYTADEEENIPYENMTLTFRDEPVLSRDYNSDGQVEVPYPVTLPGREDMADSEDLPLKLTLLMHLTRDGFSVVYQAVINEPDNYLVYYPDRWLDSVTVVTDTEAGEWRFYKLDPVNGEPTVELLRIQAYSSKDFTDLFASEDSISLGTQGTRHYSAYIPRSAGEPLAISEAELSQMFQILP